MEWGDDYVAARVSVDVPDGSAQAIREITQEVERFHTTLEAAVHAEADATRYLDQMAESARRTSETYAQLIQQMETFIQLSSRASGAMPAMGPSGAQGGGGGMGARVPSASDVASQIQGAAGSNEREYLNMQHQRNNISNADMISISPESISDLANKIAQRDRVVKEQLSHTDGNTDSKVPSGGQGPEDPQTMAQRIGRASTLAGQVMNEIGPGGSMMGMGNLAVRGLNWASKRRSMTAPGRGEGGSAEAGLPTEQAAEGEEGAGLGGGGDPEAKGLGGLKGLTKYLGPIAGVATSALAIYGLIQKGGGMIQGMRNEASIRGGAAGEGAEVSLKARLTAMNPFITQDQARQLYQAVMSEGYADASGSGADNVIDFMTHNLTTMNISVADSAKMLRSTIIGSGQGDKNSVAGSVQMLGKELDTIRTLSRDGVMSQPDYRAGVMATQASVLAMGGTPEEAERTALTAEQVGSGDQAMKGQFGRIAGSLANERGSMWLRTYGGPGGTPLQGLPQGLFPQLTGEALQEQGGDAYNRAVENALTAFAKQSSAVQGPEENKVYMFQQRLKRMGVDTDATSQMNVAKKLYEEVLSGRQGEELKKAEGQIQQQGIGGKSGGRGGGDTKVSGAVTIDLTPQAAQLLTVVGGKQASLTGSQKGANMGLSGHQVNSPAIEGV
jgi:hypothetical protein